MEWSVVMYMRPPSPVSHDRVPESGSILIDTNYSLLSARLARLLRKEGWAVGLGYVPPSPPSSSLVPERENLVFIDIPSGIVTCE